MIQYLISSLIFNTLLVGFLFYKTMYIPKKYKRVIVIEEKSGARQIRIDWAKEIKGNTISLLNKKIKLQYDTESREDNGEKTDIDFIDNFGKPVIILRTNGEKYTYCSYENQKITGLTKDQRIWFADQVERVKKQYTLEGGFSRFIDAYGRDVIWGIILLGTIYFMSKFAGQPSEQLISNFGGAIESLKQAVLSIGEQLGNIEAINGPGI